MPSSIVRRAEDVLKQLEANYRGSDKAAVASVRQSGAQSGSGVQLSFFQLDDPVLSQIRDEILKVDIDNLTPMAALCKLNDIKQILTGKG